MYTLHQNNSNGELNVCHLFLRAQKLCFKIRLHKIKKVTAFTLPPPYAVVTSTYQIFKSTTYVVSETV